MDPSAPRPPRILYGYAYTVSEVYPDVEKWTLDYLQRLRDAGFDVEGFCLTLNPPGPGLQFPELEARWRRGDRDLLAMYEGLEKRLGDRDVLINSVGINLHPEFVRQLSAFTVYQCFDDIDGLNEGLTKPVAHAYDLCVTGNVAEVDTYRQAGIANVEWTPMGLFPGVYDPELTGEKILAEPRDIDLFMMIDRLAPWGNRQVRLDQLAGAFPEAHFYGRGWPRGFLPHDRQLGLMRRARIGPNIHLATGPLNFRTYYLPANGVLQVCDNKRHLAKVFEPGREAVGFDTIAECIDACRYYLAHEDERRQIAAAGWQRAMTDYNEVAVFRRLVGIIEQYRHRAPAKPAGSPIAMTQKTRTRWRRAAWTAAYPVRGLRLVLKRIARAICRRSRT